jgi:septum site-determining protein MinD
LGQFQATGTVPSFVQEIKDKGGFIPMEIFSNDAPKTQPVPPKKAG